MPESALTSAQQMLQRTLLAKVYDVAEVTPLQSMTKLGQRLGLEVQLKREDCQPVHSFKLRGAYNCIAHLSQAQLDAGVVAASAGNHAQGVALAAKSRGCSAVIVMPTTTPDIKVDAVVNLGAEVVLHGDSFDQANAHAKSLSEQQGRSYIHPFDDLNVIAGQATVAQEMVQQNRQLQLVFVPVGGGGLAAGMAAYYKALLPHVKVIGVESQESACLQQALNAGEPVDLSQVGLFADGVAVKRIGEKTFALAQECLDSVVTVTSDEICAAVKDIFEDTRAIAEPSGALALAGLKRYLAETDEEYQQAAAVLSGANVNFHSLRYVSERCELGEGREAVLAVQIPERPGSFLAFCQMLGGRAVTEFNYRFSSREQAQVFVGLRTSPEQSGLQDLIERLQAADYRVLDLSQDEIAKQHIRYMVGGRPPVEIKERLYSFEFPEHPGALERFLTTLGGRWNISLFHYRNHGAAFGRVLVGFEVPDAEQSAFQQFLTELGLVYQDESTSPGYQAFLS
ncbi:threonine ammonia-lyase, biosynthetic [Paraferrimonas sedimenticola]|uniref:L-threonine dehydratase n=1 Tax=Paraferrimonas sedimenticola TaxID=375674 RepID=A0AA37RUS3_9GAMM|nr:threonine ammonia-lyase, biosynthetic [Paraferrimonas sedimenticola]GLP95252.1 L-threonine dehydratase [Paraferrimonas sedimenticola]